MEMTELEESRGAADKGGTNKVSGILDSVFNGVSKILDSVFGEKTALGHGMSRTADALFGTEKVTPEETWECPFCEKIIKTSDIKCRYCGSDLSD